MIGKKRRDILQRIHKDAPQGIPRGIPQSISSGVPPSVYWDIPSDILLCVLRSITRSPTLHSFIPRSGL